MEYCVLFHGVNLALTAIFLTGQITEGVNLVSKKLSLSPSDVVTDSHKTYCELNVSHKSYIYGYIYGA